MLSKEAEDRDPPNKYWFKQLLIVQNASDAGKWS